MCRWGQQRDETFKRGLGRLRQDIIRANRLAREAGLLAAELGYTDTSYSVTLQVGGGVVRCATSESRRSRHTTSPRTAAPAASSGTNQL